MNVQVFARTLALGLALALPTLAAAQPTDVAPSEAPPHLIRLEGPGAQVIRDGTGSPLHLGDPVLFGDRLVAGDAYAQLLWGDGSRVALDRGAELEVLSVDVLAVTAGRVLVMRPAAATVALRIDTPAASFLLAPGGEYRFSLEGLVTTLGVVRGRADVQTGMGNQVVEPGQQIVVRDGIAPPAPGRYNDGGYDSFVEWANTPAAAPAHGTPLETFEDPRLEAYTDVFNRHGSWQTDPQVGAVWYPTVASDWRPYADGYWQEYGPESQWLWVGRDPFGWPTHHFGRWGVSNAGRWYWEPGRQWAPAWVSWSVGPGYIGWTPLGSQDRPLWGWDALSSRRGAYAGATLDPARAWTVIPSDRFGQPLPMRAYAVDPRTLDNLSAFVSQRAGPPSRYGTPQAGYGGPNRRDPRAYGRTGGTAVYGPGGYSGGVRSRTGDETTGDLRRGPGPTRVGPPAPGYGGPTPPPDDPYDRAQRVMAPRGRQRSPEGANAPGAPPPATARPRTPPSDVPQTERPPAAPQSRPTPPPAAEPAPPAPDRSSPPDASVGRSPAPGTSTGRRAVPRPE